MQKNRYSHIIPCTIRNRTGYSQTSNRVQWLIVPCLLLLFQFGVAADINGNDSGTEKYRLVWAKDPTTEATVAWNQKSGDPGVVHYGTKDFGRKHHLYPKSQKTHRTFRYTESINNCFASLSDLQPDTRYFFCIKDKQGVSRRLTFVTAPDKPIEFTFIAGGDSRNFREPRIHANQICTKLQPLFIAFTGDMINRDTEEEWTEWLEDWQQTIDSEGNIIPIVPHRGNHESRPESIYNYFDTPEDAYYHWAIGDDMFRYFTLNSQIPADGKQGKWLRSELKKYRKNTTHLVAGYHKPMRPHVSKKSEGDNPLLWADTFYQCGLDLAIESDSHVMKRTLPLKPDRNGTEGFSRSLNDKNATVYIGEGCWGAPLRAADDSKPWTIDAASFNGFDWILVTPDRIEVKTVMIQNPIHIKKIDPAKIFENPTLKLWEPKGGSVLIVPGDRQD
ncbi:MAG: metallophosphoesterase family protein [Verrucomicrobiales bacterium]|nr:metallophosphoesterase family protein [Verrucomicrobiales bacterium]